MNKRFKAEPYIRYANCYEDAETLLKLIGTGKAALSIASAGDNCLALLSSPDLQKLYIFDRNPAQLYLTKLKFAAFKYLEHDEVLMLLGLSEGSSAGIYAKIRANLDEETREYFDKRPEIIEKVKLIHCGKFEHYHRLLRKYILRFTQCKKTVKKFMSFEDASLQKHFYLKKINNFRWRIVTKRFFGKKALAKHGRDKSHFAYAENDLAKLITDRMLLCFDNVPNAQNSYLQYSVTGCFGCLPFYLRRENFDNIKTNIDKAEFILGDVAAVAEKNLKIDFFNLSDIFEYMSEEETQKNEKMILDMANGGATVVFWNMMVDRQFHESEFSSFDSDKTYQIYKNEKAYYYQALRIYIKK